MDTKTILALHEAGVDTDGALRRFANNAALYEKFMYKFLQDENFGQIGPALEAGRFDDALTAAHTLKGVSGNLGMTRLYEACSETVALIRAGSTQEARASYPSIEAAYRDVCAVLSGGGEARR